MTKTPLLFILFFFWILCGQANSQLLDSVSYQISEIPRQVQAGERFMITVRADIEGEWHLYSALNDPDAGPYPTTFTSAAENLFIAGETTETEARIVLDPNFNEKLGWHSDEAIFTVPVAFDTLVSGDKQQVILDILYQVCDDKSCLPPKTKEVSAEIFVAGIADEPFLVESNPDHNFNYFIYNWSVNFTSSAEARSWIFWLAGAVVLIGVFYFRKLTPTKENP